MRPRLAATEDSSLKVLKSDDNYSHIIKCSSKERVFEDVLDSHARLFVDVLNSLELFVVFDTVPHTVNDILVRHLIEDAIAAKHQEVMSEGAQLE